MKENNWHNLPWIQFYNEVSQIQELIVMAYRDNNYKLVYQLQRRLVVSYATRAIAVRRVISNSGGKTPGIDKQLWDSPKKRMDALLLLKEIVHTPKEYKASPLHRVWIPKQNTTEKRPLGIPTLTDRAVQAIYQMAIDPIVEEQSDPNSYGFRLYRSGWDAVTRLRTLLDKRSSPHWILDAAVAKCFDRISHDFLIKNTLLGDKCMLEEWLKCGVLDGGILKETDTGTPQGGIISPTLCNIALNGLEQAAIDSVRPKRGERNKIHLTRYADDFVCTASDRTMLENEIKESISRFLEVRGLEFKESKTQIVNLNHGFDFLGFTFQRKDWNYKLNKPKKDDQKTVLIIKPKSEKVKQLREKIRKVILPDRPIESIIRDLNPVLRGWSEYFRISYHSLETFWSLGHYIWRKMWRWARKRHPRKRADWVFEKYVMVGGDRKWIFGKSLSESLFDISKVTHYGLFPIKQGRNPYLMENREYYERRRQDRIEAKFRAAIYRVFKHRCPHCGESLYNGEPIELHHIKSKKDGGEWSMSNIQPLHLICHQSVTYGGTKKL